MHKRVILVTGTPCVGKTSVSQALSTKLKANYVNLTDLANSRKLISGEDKKRKTLIIDESKMRKELAKIIKETDEDLVIDGHYCVNVIPKELVAYVFVLRRDPVELRKLMEQRGFSDPKLWENLASEILDVCLVDALNAQGKGKVCELDTSSKSVEEVVAEILAILESGRKCRVGVVDWIGKLENEGLLDELLRI